MAGGMMSAMAEPADSGKMGKVLVALIAGGTILGLLVLSWTYPATAGPFTAVFLLTGVVMWLRSRRSRT